MYIYIYICDCWIYIYIYVFIYIYMSVGNLKILDFFCNVWSRRATSNPEVRLINSGKTSIWGPANPEDPSCEFVKQLQDVINIFQKT